MTPIDQMETPEAEQIIDRAERAAHDTIREPVVYTKGGPSYFCDLAQRALGDSDAGERIERHGRQMAEVEKRRQLREHDEAGYEQRVNPNLEPEHGGEFAPPLWVNELFSSTPRNSEYVQKLAPRFDLPQGVSSVNLPRMTTGTQTLQQQPGTAAEDRDAVTTGVKSPAMTIEGLSDWALQVLDQSQVGVPLDWIIQKDLLESLDAKVEDYIIKGTGKNGQFLGLIELPAAVNLKVRARRNVRLCRVGREPESRVIRV
jgi:HK97 family phage major capsid protein